MRKRPLLKVFIAILFAILAGTAAKIPGVNGQLLITSFDLIGRLFLNALTLVVVPLVMASIIGGIARISEEQSLSSLGIRTFGWFITTAVLAVLIGYALAIWIAPGTVHDHIPTLMSEHLQDQLSQLQSSEQSHSLIKMQNFLLRIIPSNIFAAASQGQILSLIGFSIAFGYYSTKIETQASAVLTSFWQGVYQVLMKMIHLIMRALPIGVFGLVAKVIATTGLETVKPVALFFSTVLFGLTIYSVVVIPLLLKVVAKISPVAYFRSMVPALFTAFSTSSSAASLPAIMECLEKNVGVSSRVAGFVIPLGGSVNMAGSALHALVAVFFIVQTYGIDLSLGMQFLVIVMAFSMSFGMAGIPSASIISIVMILQALDLPADGMALILTVERILDMFRTMVNALSNATCATLVASAEKSNVLVPV